MKKIITSGPSHLVALPCTAASNNNKKVAHLCTCFIGAL